MSIVHSSECVPLRVLDDTLHLLLRSQDSTHRMAAMTVAVPAGSGVPPHRHRSEEEGYFVLEGELLLTLDGQEHRMRPGDFAHVPPGTSHGYRNPGPDTVRFLAWTVGGPIDRFFVEMSEQVRAMPDDAPAMALLAQRYGVEMVEPPTTA
jgi:quercetin dioxygenase-like cupin family protein